MTTRNDGGPAFPEDGERGRASGGEGMSLRDYFAAKAMQSEMLRAAYNQSDYMDTAASRAYLMADAMLRARETPPEN